MRNDSIFNYAALGNIVVLKISCDVDNIIRMNIHTPMYYMIYREIYLRTIRDLYENRN